MLTMQTVELLVKLKIPDVTALTAAGALRRRMGFEGVLTSLARADYYRLELAVDTPEEALALARDLAENTNVFVNPNKHVYEARTGTQAAAKEGSGIGALCHRPRMAAPGRVLALQVGMGYGR